MAASTSIPFSSTSLSAVTGVPTDTASTGTGLSTVIGAVLTESDTTVTALSVPGTTGLAVVDGSTISWRHQGITLSNGDVVSIGFDGLVDSTTTASYQMVTVSAGESVPQSATVTANASGSLVTVSGTRSASTSSPSATSGASSGASSATSANSSSSSPPSVTSMTTLTTASPSSAVTSVSSPSPAGSASAASSAASGGSSTTSASSTSSSGAAATLSAGKAAVALVGALGGMVAYGL